LCNNHFLASRNRQKHTPAKHKFPSKLLFGTDMFTFDTRLHFTHTYNVVNVQKITFNFKAHYQFIEIRNNNSN